MTSFMQLIWDLQTPSPFLVSTRTSSSSFSSNSEFDHKLDCNWKDDVSFGIVEEFCDGDGDAHRDATRTPRMHLEESLEMQHETGNRRPVQKRKPIYMMDVDDAKVAVTKKQICKAKRSHEFHEFMKMKELEAQKRAEFNFKQIRSLNRRTKFILDFVRSRGTQQPVDETIPFVVNELESFFVENERRISRS